MSELVVGFRDVPHRLSPKWLRKWLRKGAWRGTRSSSGGHVLRRRDVRTRRRQCGGGAIPPSPSNNDHAAAPQIIDFTHVRLAIACSPFPVAIQHPRMQVESPATGLYCPLRYNHPTQISRVYEGRRAGRSAGTGLALVSGRTGCGARQLAPTTLTRERRWPCCTTRTWMFDDRTSS